MAPVQGKKPNPFDLHVNRKKFTVIGKKTKGEKGRPSHSKGFAYKKRQDTLLKEYKFKHKVNQSIDRRIGEFDKTLSKDEKMMKRMVSISRKSNSKKNRFNLNEDEEMLTHGGNVLTDSNMHDDITMSDDEDMDRLDAHFVENQHFGGGAFPKPDKLKSKKEKLLEVIAESKKKKYESKKQEEQHRAEVAELNLEMGQLAPHFFGQQNQEKNQEPEDRDKEKEYDPYDELVKSLRASREVAKASKRLQTDQEIEDQQTKFLEFEKAKLKERNQIDMDIEDEEKEQDDAVKKSPKKSFRNKDKAPKAPPLKLFKEIDVSSEAVDVPEEFEDFWKMVTDAPVEESKQILRKMVQFSHPSTPSGSTEKCQMLLRHLVQAVTEIGSRNKKSTKGSDKYSYLDTIIEHVIIVTYFTKQYAVNYMLQVFNKMKEEFQENNCSMPYSDFLLFVHLCTEQFPISDRQHPFLSLVRTFVGETLWAAKLETQREICSSLILLSLLVKMSVTPARVCTSILAFLRRLFRSCTQEKDENLLAASSPLKAASDFVFNWSSANMGPKKVPEKFKAAALLETTRIAKLYMKNLKDEGVLGGWFAGQELIGIVEKIPIENYDAAVVEEVADLKKSLKTRGEIHIPQAKTKPKRLEMLAAYIPDKNTLAKTSQFQTKMLKNKVKKERRSARRELKKDTQFLAKVQRQETLKSDAERKRKVRIVMSGLATQESEHQKRKKMKH